MPKRWQRYMLRMPPTTNDPMVGKDAIYAMLSEELASEDRICIVEHILKTGSGLF